MSTFIAPPHGNEQHIPGKFSALAKDITEGRLTVNAAPERQPQSPFASDPTKDPNAPMPITSSAPWFGCTFGANVRIARLERFIHLPA